jgi:hypothetical protein
VNAFSWPPSGGYDLAELARRIRRRSLEHQMLEEMSDTRAPDRVVGRAVAVPHHVGHHGHPPVGHHDHVQSVIKHEGRDLRSGSGRGGSFHSVGTERWGSREIVHLNGNNSCDRFDAN